MSRRYCEDVSDEHPPVANSSQPSSLLMSRLIAAGRVIAPEIDGDLLELWPPPPLERGERTGSDILADLRADER
jgi:hypothetical protein